MTELTKMLLYGFFGGIAVALYICSFIVQCYIKKLKKDLKQLEECLKRERRNNIVGMRDRD